MAYKTYAEQLLAHLQTLNDNGLLVADLTLDKWVRCRSHSDSTGRGEHSYISNTETLSSGLIGIRTSFRGPNGLGSFKTYGLPPIGNESVSVISAHCSEPNSEAHELAARKTFGFWEHSSTQGTSEYLMRKGVGCYGIRFRSSEQYGNVAVVPMRDEYGKLWSYQLLNPDGTKRFAKDARVCNLYHALRPIEKAEIIGIAESYVTAATCMELTGIICTCCFGCNNLKGVVSSILSRYENKRIVIFADNDRHNPVNEGLLKAQEAQKIDESRVYVSAPDFVDCRACKEASDWNDLARLFGRDVAQVQMSTLLTNLASNP